MNKFKNNSGVLYLQALFYEQTSSDKSSVIYTLKDDDHEGYPSLYRLYMSYNDPTEYQFAIDNLDSWKHWQDLCKCKWFQPYHERWKEEMLIKIKSIALSRIMDAAENDPKSKFQANKYLIEKGWIEKEPANKVGRTTNEKIRKQAINLHHNAQSVEDDHRRLFGGSKFN